AKKMQELLSKLLPKKMRSPKSDSQPSTLNLRPTICTFHSLCVRVLRQHIEKLGYKRNFVIYNESEQLAAIKKILSLISAKGEQVDPHLILTCLSRNKNGASKVSSSEEESAAALARHILPRYESALRACNAIDFDDLLL